jgi:hypothetical protein
MSDDRIVLDLLGWWWAVELLVGYEVYHEGKYRQSSPVVVWSVVKPWLVAVLLLIHCRDQAVGKKKR